MTWLGLDTAEWAILLVAFAAAGVVRGFTGGLGANFLTAPVLSAMIGPREAVPAVILLNMLGNVQIMPTALPYMRWREAWPLFTVPALTVPFGAWVLFTVDENLMRRAIAAAAAGFSLLLLTGWRYRGRHALPVSAGVAGIAGLLVGAISLGGPPVFLYLMSGRDSAVTNRAHFIGFGFGVGVIALATFALAGAYTTRLLLLAAVLFVPSFVCISVGTWLFRRASDEIFRRVCLWGLVAVSLAVLVL